MLRETNGQLDLWEALLPEPARRLPEELTLVDAFLDDERFVVPWRAVFAARLGRPSVPIDTLLRLAVPQAPLRAPRGATQPGGVQDPTAGLSQQAG